MLTREVLVIVPVPDDALVASPVDRCLRWSMREAGSTSRSAPWPPWRCNATSAVRVRQFGRRDRLLAAPKSSLRLSISLIFGLAPSHALFPHSRRGEQRLRGISGASMSPSPPRAAT